MTKEQLKQQLSAIFAQASETEISDLVSRCFSAEHSNKVLGVEIFDVGKHNGDKYTEQDVDDMLAAFKELDFRPALKVGHTEDFAGAPAFGWVTNLRKAGTKMLADFESMHDSVIAALRDRRYDRVSSEIYFNLKRKGKVFRRALKAVALLGAEPPAVAGLVPLHKMEFADAGAFESLAQAGQKFELEQQALIDALSARVVGLTQTLNEQKEQHNMDLKALRAKKEELEGKLAELSAKDQSKFGEAEKKQLADLSTEIKSLGTKIGEEIDALIAKAGKADALEGTVASLAAKERARDVQERVSKCTVAAFRPMLTGLYMHAVANDAVRVKVLTLSADGKTSKEEEKSLSETLDVLVGAINAGAKNLFSVTTSSQQQQRQEGPTDGDPGAEIDHLAKLRVAEGKAKTYDEAVDAVLATDPELKKRYHEAHQSRAA